MATKFVVYVISEFHIDTFIVIEVHICCLEILFVDKVNTEGCSIFIHRQKLNLSLQI